MTTGVYIARDADDTILYVGSSADIEGRISRHRSVASPWLTETASVEKIPTATRHLALHLEREMIRELQPKFNVLSKSAAKKDSKAVGPVVVFRMDVLATLISERGGVAQLGAAIGVGYQNMSAIWRGVRLPSSKVIARLMLETGLSFDDLFRIEVVDHKSERVTA